ncbi:MAG: substrate-binding domain-containing protein [Nakamurella sp.]
MGRHADEERGRGLAGWLIGAVSAGLVMVLAVVGYFVVLSRANSADQSVCSSNVTLSVVAGPDASPALSQAAGAYSKTKPVVRSACITAVVSTASDDAVLAGLTGRWPVKDLPAPGMWIPDSAASLSALDGVRPDLAAGHATDPFAWSPLVLAMRSSDAASASSLTWADLATAAGPAGTVSLPNGRHLILALPPIASSRASSYALQSVVAGADPTVPVDAATVTAKTHILRSIDAGHSGQATTTQAALTSLAVPSSAADHAAVTAVPAVEANLVLFDRHSTGDTLTAVRPQGSTVGDALIAAPISAQWTGRTSTAAASDFQSFLSSVPGQQILADHGWRTKSAHPAEPLAAVNTQASVTMVPAGGPSIDTAIAVALGQAKPPKTTATSPTATHTSPTPTTSATAPATSTSPPSTTTTSPANPNMADKGPIITLIVDTSSGMSTENGGKTLLDWVKAALPDLADGSLTNRIGLWVYSDGAIYPPSGFPELVSTGLITEKVKVPELAADGSVATTVEEARSKALVDSIAKLTPNGDRWAYGALVEALPKAATAAVTGRQNRVILITSGVDQTPGTLRSQVLRAVHDQKEKLRLDVIGLGSAVPVAAYTDIAAAANGEYVPITDPAKLGQQISDFLTLGD